MERNDGSNKNSNTKPKIDFDFAADEQAPVIPEKTSQASKAVKEDDGLGFSLDFDMDLVKSNSSTKTGLTVAASFAEEDHGGFTLDDNDIGDVDTKEDATQKTVLFNALSNYSAIHYESQTLYQCLKGNISAIQMTCPALTYYNLSTFSCVDCNLP